MLRAEDLKFSYATEGLESPVLRGISLEINEGDFVALQGPSGSGKSTLFYILGGLLRPTSGKIFLRGLDLTLLSDSNLARFRNRDLGFVFQQFHLLPRASVVDNILLPTLTSETGGENLQRKKAIKLAERVGLGAFLDRMPNQLSGGQQQRVAIARALMNDPEIILADEPTGNLDSKNADEILKLFRELNKEGKTILLVTHDSQIAQSCPQRIVLKDGSVSEVVGLRPIAAHAGSQANAEIHEVRPNLGALLRSSFTQIKSALPLAMDNLKRNKVKSLSTMLGVIIGISAVLSMITLGNFSKRRILESYQALGVNKVVIRGFENHRQRSFKLNTVRFESFDERADIEPLRKIFPEIQLMSPQLNAWSVSAIAGGLVAGDRVGAMGVNAEYFAITNLKIKEGMQFFPHHLITRSAVCVIGSDIADKLFPNRSALGQVISVSLFTTFMMPCRVIGVLADVSTNSDWLRPNSQIYLPLTYYQASLAASWAVEIHEVSIQFRDGVDTELMGKKLKGYFIQKYGQSGFFMVDSDSKLIAQMKRFLNIFTLLLIGIALLSLIVGGIGINNMMLISVTERLKEIGLRKALGATNRSIRTQILTESVLLSTVAGLLGTVIGFAGYEFLIYAATKLVPKLKFEWVFEPTAVLFSVLSIVLVGVGSGFLPALKAEKLEVIEALRSE